MTSIIDWIIGGPRRDVCLIGRIAATFAERVLQRIVGWSRFSAGIGVDRCSPLIRVRFVPALMWKAFRLGRSDRRHVFGIVGHVISPGLKSKPGVGMIVPNALPDVATALDYERYPISHRMMMIGSGIPISQSNPPLSIKSSFNIDAWSNAVGERRFRSAGHQASSLAGGSNG